MHLNCSNAQDLFTKVSNSLLAHQYPSKLIQTYTHIALLDAYIKCQRLHRDVSVGNIILIRERSPNPEDNARIMRAELIDWELSAFTSDGNDHDLTVCLFVHITLSNDAHTSQYYTGNLAIYFWKTSCGSIIATLFFR